MPQQINCRKHHKKLSSLQARKDNRGAKWTQEIDPIYDASQMTALATNKTEEQKEQTS